MANRSAPPSPVEVDERLCIMSALSDPWPLGPPLVDMSPTAVDDRLHECAEISALCMALVAAGEQARGE